MLVAAIAHFTELVEEDPASKSVSSFPSGQTCAGSFPQFQAAHPFQCKEGPLQSPQFAQGNCESVLPGICGQAFQDRRSGGGSGLDGGREPEDFGPVVNNVTCFDGTVS